MSVAVSPSVIAFQSGNTQISIFLVWPVAAVLGFMVLNFPMGKIFLGDGGAYALGHLVVWSAIILSSSASESVPLPFPCVFLAGGRYWIGYLASLEVESYRSPDRLHFHQLAMRFLEIRFFGREQRVFANPVATLTLMPLISVPQILGVLCWDDFKASVLSAAGVGLLFVVTYLVGIALAKKGRIG